MMRDAADDFYRTYSAFKSYRTPVITAKQIRWYDREFWVPARCNENTSVLELGCGTGEFLAYLDHKRVARYRTVERDQDAVVAMQPQVRPHVIVEDFRTYLADASERWDRVVMLDVLEHFSSAEGVRLLERIMAVLAPDDFVIARVPNMGSPWEPIHQYGDLTHKAAYTAVSLEQLGVAAGYDIDRFLPQRRGTSMRRFLEDCLNWVLARMLTVSPVIWTANIIVIHRVRAS